MSEQWRFALTADSAFVVALEDALTNYERQYARLSGGLPGRDQSPVVGPHAHSAATCPWSLDRHDPEYVRDGVVYHFFVTEPLQGWRHVTVSQQPTRLDFAHCVKELVDVHYPGVERIVLVYDQLNIHAIASLHAGFPTRRRGSWLSGWRCSLSCSL